MCALSDIIRRKDGRMKGSINDMFGEDDSDDGEEIQSGKKRRHACIQPNLPAHYFVVAKATASDATG